MTTYEQSRWSLDGLYPALDSPALLGAFREMEALVAEFESARPELTDNISAGIFLTLIDQLEAIERIGYRIQAFAQLAFAADTQDSAIQSFLGDVENRIAEIGNRILFFSLWWKGLNAQDAARLLAVTGDVRYWLEAMRNFQPFTLSELEEKIINLKDVTGSNALVNLYDAITNRYTFKFTVDGEEQEMTRGEIMSYARGSDPAAREAAYRELYRVYGHDGPILGQVYQARVRDWYNEQVGLRGYGSPIAARNLENDLPDAVVNTMLEVCRKNAPVFQRFFRLKARRLGVERLRRYDLYAPLEKSSRVYGFNQASELVLDAFGRFDENVAVMAERVFEQGRLDGEVRKGKRGGAFCYSVEPGMTPWVLLNFQGKPDDVATMAHELGHAVHSMLASNHRLFTFHSSLPLAETASTFGEMLLIERMLKEEPDPTVRRDLLFRQVDDAYATIQRQAFFAMFERKAHEMIREGATPDQVSDWYIADLREQFGDSVEVSDEFRWEWVSIPHFYHVPFYVYAYSFGQLLVLALYQQYQAEGEAFKPRYLEILAAGGSDAPARILERAGIDISSAAFWQGGFDGLSRLVDQLESL